jgi:beta-galactosidase
MKKRMKQLMAVMLSVALCVPAIPGAYGYAATSGTTFTQEEEIALSGLGSERSTLFNDGWKFSLSDPSGAESTSFNDGSWDAVTLPHDFSISQNFTTSGEAESGFLPGGTGWYRKSFTVPSGCDGKSVILSFDGVYQNAYVYVNGKQVGENHYGYTSFAFDISKYLVCDGLTDNVIAVKVVNKLPSSRWYSGSGIYRDVKLIVADQIHVIQNGTQITTPDIENGVGTVSAKVKVANSGTSSANITVRNTVYDKKGQKVSESAETTLTVEAGSSAEASTNNVVTNPSLWSLDDPTQYYVRTEILSAGSVVDTYDTTFGFRWYKFTKNTGFSLNGENVKLNGVCMHHDQGALGSAAYRDAMYRQISILKNMGVNLIRATHNPYDEDFIDICDELGILVIEEAFDGWELAKNGNSNDFSVYFNKTLTGDNEILDGDTSMTWAEFAIKSMVKRDRNDPSVILWSLGNEIDEGCSGSTANYPTIAENLINWIKEVDTQHPATLGSNRKTTSGNIAGAMAKVVASGGIAGYNYASSSDLDRLADYNGGVILASETSSATNSRGIYVSTANNQNVDGKLHLTSYDTSKVGWGKTAHDSIWDTVTKDKVAGECVWTGFDYIGEPTPWNGTGTGSSNGNPYPNSSYFGIVETTGFPKDTYYLYRSQWKQDDTTLHLVTAWDSDNMINKSGMTPVWVYSNAAKVELYRNGKKVGTATRTVHTTDAGHKYYTYTTQSADNSVCTTTSGANSESLYSVFNVAYEKGTISAKAYDESGKEITDFEGTASVSTPDAPAKLVVSKDKESITADGSSLSYISVDVTDANGNPDTTATNNIRFTLTGDGEIVGVDNGDQATVSKYQQASVLTGTTSANINAYAGKALVIVRSTNKAGNFTVKAESDSLTGGEAVVTTSSASDNNSNAMTSYRMAKHLYAPVGSSNVELPANATASYADGTTKTCKITWKSYDKAALKTVGSFRIEGSFTDGTDTVEVSITAHIYGKIKGAENYSCITKPNTLPELPKTAMTYYADGSPFEAREVTWNLDGITEDTFKNIGDIITINGSVTAFGETYPITASVRVAEPVIDKYDNVATAALHLTDNGPYNDTLAAINDGNRSDNGYSDSRWSTWDKKDDSTHEDAVITMDWATAIATNQINLFYFYQPNDHAQSKLPTTVKFEYTLNSGYENGEIVSNGWQEITPAGEPEEINDPSLHKWTKGYTYKFAETINPIAIRITFSYTGFIGLNEAEVMTPTTTYRTNTSAELSGIKIGNTNLTLGSDDRYEIDESSFDGLSFTNPENASVTVIPVSNREIKIVSVAEDGKSRRTYSVVLKNVPLIPEETETPDTKETETPNTKPETPSTDKPQTPSTPALKKGDTFKVKNIQYKVLNVSKKTVAVVKGTDRKPGKVTKVTIPNTVKNAASKTTFTVTQIQANAFKNYKNLKSVIIGKNVTSIGKNSFYGCQKLAKVTFKGTSVKTIKSKAFKKTASKVTVSVPKSIRNNKKKAAAFQKKLTKSGISKKLKLK